MWCCCASALTNEKCGFRWDGGHGRILKHASGVIGEIGAERSNGGASPFPAADISSAKTNRLTFLCNCFAPMPRSAGQMTCCVRKRLGPRSSATFWSRIRDAAGTN